MQELYQQYKPLLFHLAYQMSGSIADAEDAVQDVFVKLAAVNIQQIAEPKAYLCKMVANRCLDELKSARKRREQYVGPWLPEPLPTAGQPDLVELVIQDEQLSYGLLVLLERLTPGERAVFVLREAMGFDYADIAELLDRSAAGCRKLMSRAKGKLGGLDHVNSGSADVGRWVEHFLAALAAGKVNTVVAMLSEDAVLLSDGGGKVSAATRPLVTREAVAKFLIGVTAKQTISADGTSGYELTKLNGQAGLLFRSGTVVHTAVLFALDEGLLSRVYIIRNPDKLAHLQQA